MALPIESTDPAVMRLSHPLRCASENSEAVQRMKDFLGPKVWGNLAAGFDSDRLAGDVASELCRHPENRRLRDMLQIANRMAGGTEVGNSYSTLLFLRHAMHPQPYFVIDDKLVSMLEETDISDEVSTGVLQVPYPRFFVEFGKERKTSLRLSNTLSGLHILEGAYIERGRNSDGVEGLFVLLTGSPIGKEHAMDDATHSFFLALDRPEMPIRAALRESFEKGRKLSLEHNLRMTPEDSFEEGVANMLFLLKVLLYIGMPDVRREVHKEKTEWTKATSSLQSTAKKAKAERRGRALVDHIRIYAPPPRPTSENGPGDARTVKTHWRRAHFREQAYGPQWSQRKVILVPVTLVNADLGVANVPTYKVS